MSVPVEALARRWAAAWAGGEGFAGCCTPDVSYEDPVLSHPVERIDELTRHAARLREALPDLRVETAAESLFGDGHACLPWRVTGTHLGEVGRMPATGRGLDLHGMHYVEIVDDRIRRARGFFDLYGAGVQLGMLPARDGTGEAALLAVRGFGVRRRGRLR